jgi:hypothetical protein
LAETKIHHPPVATARWRHHTGSDEQWKVIPSEFCTQRFDRETDGLGGDSRILALRLHLGEGSRGRVAWRFSLADMQMMSVTTVMHDDPARCWTMQVGWRRASD